MAKVGVRMCGAPAFAIACVEWKVESVYRLPFGGKLESFNSTRFTPSDCFAFRSPIRSLAQNVTASYITVRRGSILSTIELWRARLDGRCPLTRPTLTSTVQVSRLDSTAYFRSP